MAKARGASVNLDSFLDIMTCLVGVLVLIIILTGLDAAQIRVLIPTPMQYDSPKRPIFIEARNNQLFLIPLEEFQAKADAEIRRISEEARGDMGRVLSLIGDSALETDDYLLDLTFFMVGQFGLRPRPGVEGYDLTNWEDETRHDWFGQIIYEMDLEEQMLSFLVRDDSFDVFKVARHLAWLSDIDVAYELLDMEDVIRFGFLGLRPRPQ